jgi:hypothetical protein
MNIGTKLEHFKKLQGNLEFHQNKCHPRNIPDMRRQYAKAADQWAQGVAGRPNEATYETSTSISGAIPWEEASIHHLSIDYMG